MADASGNVASAGQRMNATTVTVTWAVLVGASLLSWLLASGASGGAARSGLVAIAAVKIYLVIAVFMGLWHAPRAWHAAAVAWIAATFGIVLVLVTGVQP